MRWWLRFALGVVGAVALGWLFSWLFFQPCLRWLAVFLQLLGIAAIVAGIIETRYGLTLTDIVRNSMRRPRTINLEVADALQAQDAMTVELGKMEITHTTEHRLSALEQRFDWLQGEMEARISGLDNDSRQRDAELEAKQLERYRRLKEEVFQKHPQEVMGIGWAAVGIALSGFG